MENFTVQLFSSMIYDQLHTLAAEYSTSTDVLIHLAVKRLLEDVKLIRKLREGKITLE